MFPIPDCGRGLFVKSKERASRWTLAASPNLVRIAGSPNMSYIHTSRRTMNRAASISSLALAAALSATSAFGLVINPTYGTTGGASAFSTQDRADIQAVINLYEATFTDAITVNITFNNMNGGLGQSNTAFFTDSYANIHARLIADGSSVDDAAALAQLTANSSGISANLDFSEANAKALGYTGFGSGQDSIIGLNAGICFNVHNATTAAANPTKYDLFGVAAHELDEALGTVSGVGDTDLMTADLYRYNNAGARSFTTSGSTSSYFSINGSALLDQYNQGGLSNGGDFGDWVIHNPSQVQDWEGTPGVLNDPNVEFRLLDAVGYDRAAVPEPASIAALGLGLAVLIRRRKKS